MWIVGGDCTKTKCPQWEVPCRENSFRKFLRTYFNQKFFYCPLCTFIISLLFQPWYIFWYLPIWLPNKKSTNGLECSMPFYQFHWPLLYLLALASSYCSKIKAKEWLTWFNFVDWSRLPLRQACKLYGKDTLFAQINCPFICRNQLQFLVISLVKYEGYTVNNYRQVTGMVTGENFAFFIYRHFVETL